MNATAELTQDTVSLDVTPPDDGMIDAVYVRVSGVGQRFASQEPELKRYVAAHFGGRTKWYWDKFTGKVKDRPGWNALERDMRAGKVRTVLVWKLDRLGRNARDLTALFAELQERGITFVSITEGIDLSKPSGRMMANVLASLAEYETESRYERVAAGLAAAKAAGTRLGRPPGILTRKTITQDQVDLALRLKAEGCANAAIARSVGISARSVYDLLRRERERLGQNPSAVMAKLEDHHAGA